jgi:hypothetical protein
VSCVNSTCTEVVTPKLNSATYEPIDLSDLIEAEQQLKKKVESLSESIEKYEGRIVAGLVDLGWERATSYTKTLVTKVGRLGIKVIKLRKQIHGQDQLSNTRFFFDQKEEVLSRCQNDSCRHGCEALL